MHSPGSRNALSCLVGVENVYSRGMGYRRPLSREYGVCSSARVVPRAQSGSCALRRRLTLCTLGEEFQGRAGVNVIADMRARNGNPRTRCALPASLPWVLLVLFCLGANVPSAWAQYEQPVGERGDDLEYEDDVGRADGADLDELDPEAWEEGDPYSEVEEIKVLGQQGGQMIQTGVSEIGFDAYELQQDGIKDIRDLSNFTPNLEIKTAFAASNATLFIRGVGLDDFNANAPSAVAVYQDSIYMQSPAGQLFQFYDVEGVDVLRGPMPVLYRNASAGVIHVISRKPSEEFNTYTNVTYGSYNEVDVEGAVGGAISDTLSARVSGSWSIRDGITQNRCGIPGELDWTTPGERSGQSACWDQIVNKGAPLVGDVDEWTNNWDNYAVRGQLLWKPDMAKGEMEWLLNVHGGQNASQAFQYQMYGVAYVTNSPEGPPEIVTVGWENSPVNDRVQSGPVFRTRNTEGYEDNDGNPYAGDYNVQGPENLDLYGGYLQGKWEFGDGFEIQSVTGYEGHNRFTREDSDASPANILMSDYSDQSWQVSQELRLTGLIPAPVSFGEDVDWVVGAYYLKQDLTVDNQYVYNGPRQSIEYAQNLRNFSVYGMATWTFLDDFELQFGARQNWEQKSFEILATTQPQSSTEALQSKAGFEEASFSGWGGNINLSYQVLPDAKITMKFSHGWKGGHFNGGAFNSQALISPVRPETVDAFEVGGQSRWFDGRLIVNGAFFIYDYKDLQVFNLEQTGEGATIDQLINAEHARIYGAELDIQAEPIDGLNIEFHFAWLDSYYRDFQNELEFTRSRGCPQRCEKIQYSREIEYSGNPLIASPRYAVASAIDYSINLPSVKGMSLGYLTPRVSMTWRDRTYFDACSGRGTQCNFPINTFSQGPLFLLGASVGWWSDDERFNVSVWGRNLTNNAYLSQTFDQSGPGMKTVLEVFGDPRTFGVTVGVYFY